MAKAVYGKQSNYPYGSIRDPQKDGGANGAACWRNLINPFGKFLQLESVDLDERIIARRAGGGRVSIYKQAKVSKGWEVGVVVVSTLKKPCSDAMRVSYVER